MTAARDNVEYVEAFKAQLFNPNTMSDELKVVKEAQDTFRSYEELRALREISVFWLEKEREEARKGAHSGANRCVVALCLLLMLKLRNDALQQMLSMLVMILVLSMYHQLR